MRAHGDFYQLKNPIPVAMSPIGRKTFPMRPHIGLAYSMSKDHNHIRVELEPITGLPERRELYHISLWRPARRRRPRIDPQRPAPKTDPDRVGGTA